MTPPGSNTAKLDAEGKCALRQMLSQNISFPARAEVIALAEKYGMYSPQIAYQLRNGLIPGYDYSKEAKEDEPTEKEPMKFDKCDKCGGEMIQRTKDAWGCPKCGHHWIIMPPL